MKIFFFLIIISFSFLSTAKTDPLKTKLDTLKSKLLVFTMIFLKITKN